MVVAGLKCSSSRSLALTSVVMKEPCHCGGGSRLCC